MPEAAARPLHADEARSTTPTRWGAYLAVAAEAVDDGAAAALTGAARRLGLANEYEPPADPATPTLALARRVGAEPGGLDDAGLLAATGLVHVAAAAPEPVAAFVGAARRCLGPAVLRVLEGVVRPPRFTGDALHDFAYAHRVLPQAGHRMPHVFLVPTSKTAAWWAKDWMERHTYFLPRYDDAGRKRSDGHPMVAAAGVACLLRRTYKHPIEPAPEGGYDFLNYFECAEEHVATFHAVCAALRDVSRNPEWAFVREGPTWHGRRVATWAELRR